MSALFAFLAVGCLGIWGLFLMKLQRHEELDRQRVTYIVTFPGDLEHEAVLRWLRQISRTVNTSRWNLGGSQSIVFEMQADAQGIEHRLKVPWQHKDDIIGQLRALVPGISAAPPVDRRHVKWERAIEVGESNKSLPLVIPEPDTISASLLAATQPLKEGEAVLIQWVVSPSLRVRLPADKAKAEKLKEPNVFAILRIASKANTHARADHLIGRIKTSLKPIEAPGNYWTRIRTSNYSAIVNTLKASSVPVWPAQLSAPELAALIAWPIGAPNVSGLPRGASRQLSAPSTVPKEGIVLGTSTFPGSERRVALSFTESAKHVWIAAPTGTGKTVLMTNIARQIIDNGMGMLLIETKHDLFNAVLDQIPSNRMQDVVVMDIHDSSHPIGFNLLEEGDPLQVIDDLEAIIANIHGDDKNVWLKEVMYHGLRTLKTRPGATIADLPALLSPRYDEVAWRDELLRSLKDPELLHFWQRLENQGKARQDQIVAPVLSRLWHFNARPAVRAIFGQRTSSFTMKEAVTEGKIVLVNVTGVDKGTREIIGASLVNLLWKTVRANKLDKPFYFMADEVQNLMHLPISMDELLAQARSFRLPIVMANQFVDQLPMTVRSAALTNARTKVAFQLEKKDAKMVAENFGTVTEHDFMNLHAYEGFARIATETGVSEPVSFKALPPPDSRGSSARARYVSRQNYGRPLADVEAEIAAWRKPAPGTERKKPRISGSEFFSGS